MSTEFFKSVSRILTKKVDVISYPLSLKLFNAKDTSLLESIDHFQSLNYICKKGRIQRDIGNFFLKPGSLR